MIALPERIFAPVFFVLMDMQVNLASFLDRSTITLALAFTVVAIIGKGLGVVNDAVFSALVVLVMLTTLATPPGAEVVVAAEAIVFAPGVSKTTIEVLVRNQSETIHSMPIASTGLLCGFERPSSTAKENRNRRFIKIGSLDAALLG